MQGFDNSIIFADGIDLSGNFPPVNQLGTDGYLLIGSSTGNPSAGLLSSTDSALEITGGNGTLDLTIGSGLTGTFLQRNNNLGDLGSVTIARDNLGLNLTSKGSLLVGDGSAPTTLTVGTDGFVLKADSSEPSGLIWEAGGGGASPLTTKGDLYTYSTVDARLAVGSNGTTLIADSTQTTGNKWGVLQVAGGGTSQSTYAKGDVLYASATDTLSKLTTPRQPGAFLTTGFDGEVIWFDPVQYWYIYDDLIAAFSPGQTSWRTGTNGTGTIRYSQSIGGFPGGFQFETDTSTTASLNMSKIDVDGTGAFRVNVGRQYHELFCKVSALSDGTDTYTLRVGLGDDRDGTTVANGCWFEYTHSVNSGNFTINNAGGGTTSANTATAATTNWIRYGIEINAAGDSVKFTINGTEVSGSPLTGNMPTDDFSPFFSITKSAGTNERQLLVDYYYGFGKLNTTR